MAVKTYKKGSTAKLSKNFNVSEFACNGRGCCDTVLIDDKLVEHLQKIREHFGKKVTLTSAYRCDKHNKSAKGATSSRHKKGQAADIVIEGVTPKEVAKYAETIGIKGVGLYETAKDGRFVHIDTRTTKSFWYGQAQAYRSTFGGYALTQFILDVQKATGAPADGKAGPKTLAATVTLSSSKNTHHRAVKAVQKRLKALGYTEIGNADGVAGSKFAAAVKQFQRDNGCEADGEITAGGKTWRKLLGM